MNPKSILIVCFIWLAFYSSANAMSLEQQVTPDKLDTSFYTFSVSTNATTNAVTFHVTITSKHDDIYSDSGANVDMVIHKKFADGSSEGSVGPIKPAIPVALKKENRVWTANFTVTRELIKNPDVCFVFCVLAHETINGKLVPMPAQDFYELKLQDFAKP